ncbi:hypothetical protein COU56_03510 [Candidatus Pacearchaeota archaeon CG10_big_fil_rev_8_21_14_0_10_31_9]|nr:MAG: hypothetical protein AUJ62_02190 [Candidatus Pacearchaeota archaeon CG1_02_32_21]PIN93600.1 MAG: hypothetical protein COU56_03510 [Candidatus Pacearchaeota archaeon CG10_big_fil_rev_8_21_14_0_10_31_9]PIZ82684.1 MAG: hypothetical protein COX97_03550 [Candidatus Pacearchaeota archaeon CG_4_10_14_0_2_um_filter_05_32_18]
MSEDYLKFLILVSKDFRKKQGIVDIILYGSSVKGKINPRDVDIAILFDNFSIDKRLGILREYKEKIKKKINNPDIIQINLSEFFDSHFLARESIIVEGYSLINNKPFSETLGFFGYMLFTYTLKGLNHNDKTKFTYSLIGRGKNKGILKGLNAEPIGKGAVLIPIGNSYVFDEFLKKWNIKYKSRKVLAV